MSGSPGAGRGSWRPLAAFALALVSLQALWILALPAFYGIDEFDHAYRAASVARGHWQPGTTAAEEGYGYLVPVPDDLVLAAHDTCEALTYTSRDNCNAVTAPEPDGTVLISSTAATYNPVWYSVVGTAGLPFSGEASLYAMRIAATLLADIFLVSAVAMTLRRRRPAWPVLGLALALTPILVYATIVAAPNGLCYSAAALMWVAGLTILDRETPPTRGAFVALAAAGSTVMLTHTTGVMWVLVSTICTGPLWWGRGRDLLRQHAPRWLGTGLVLGLVAAASVGWVLAAHTNDPGDTGLDAGPMPGSMLLTGPVVWTLQGIATLRFRDVPAPLPVYALALALLLTLLVLAVRRGGRAATVTLLLLGAAIVLIPLALTYVTYSNVGAAWQGRYALPLSIGFVLVVAEALRDSPPPTARWTWAIVAVMSATHVLTLRGLFAENRTGWLADPLVLIALGGVVHLAALGWAVRSTAGRPDDAPAVAARA